MSTKCIPSVVVVVSILCFGIFALKQNTSTQAQPTYAPQFEETLSYLQTPSTVELLMRRVELIWSLTVNLLLDEEHISANESYRIADFLREQYQDSAALFGLLRSVSAPEELASLRDSLIYATDRNDEPNFELDRLIDRLNIELSARDIQSSSPLILEALNSLYHVDRIASVAQSPSVERPYGGSWIVEKFPFSAFR